jgi:predicted Kef-type K+ transport protein
MRVIKPLAHGIIDYLMVIILVIGPGVAGFRGPQATICYLLAAVHFLLTIITRFPLGVTKTVPFWLHGAVEIVVAALLVILPWLANFSRGINSRNFFVLIGVLIAVIFALTDYRRERADAAGPLLRKD